MRLASFSFLAASLATCLTFAAGCAVDAASGDPDPAAEGTAAATAPSSSAAPAAAEAPAPSSAKPTPVGTNADDATEANVCVQREQCVFGTHFDRAACSCVPNDPAGGTATGGTRGGPVKHGLECRADSDCRPLVCHCIGGRERELERSCVLGACKAEGVSCDDVCLQFPQ